MEKGRICHAPFRLILNTSCVQAIIRAKPPMARDDHELYLAEVKQFVR